MSGTCSSQHSSRIPVLGSPGDYHHRTDPVGPSDAYTKWKLGTCLSLQGGHGARHVRNWYNKFCFSFNSTAYIQQRLNSFLQMHIEEPKCRQGSPRVLLPRQEWRTASPVLKGVVWVGGRGGRKGFFGGRRCEGRAVGGADPACTGGEVSAGRGEPQRVVRRGQATPGFTPS